MVKAHNFPLLSFPVKAMAIEDLVLFREKTEKAAEEEKLFKEKELEQLEKKIAEVKRVK